jgi:hypothetical protein
MRTKLETNGRAASKGTLTRLQRGHVVKLDGGAEHLIIYVNDCRAVAVPRSAKVVTVKLTRPNGEAVAFEARPKSGLNISPNSECEIVGYDYDWLAEQNTKAEAKKKAS